MQEFTPTELLKKEAYESIIPIIENLLANEENLIANLANITAVLKTQFNHLWIGFYLIDIKANQLILGPFQGPLACTRIPFEKGVCGTAWASKQTQVVHNVHEFPGHIACSSATNSEIVVPLIIGNTVWAVLDIDSIAFNTFDDEDQFFLELIAEKISAKYSQ